MTEPLLQAKGLWKSFELYSRRRWFANRTDSASRFRPALIDATLTVAAGETLGIVGESGSGKSTLARCLTLLIPPDRGEVVFRGGDLTRLRPRQLRPLRRQLQTVFQDPYSSLNPRMTVGATLAEVLRVHDLVPRGGMKERVTELLDMVGLPQTATRKYPSEFSGGQRQRISIARALAAEPALLIADEPVSSLDVSIQAQILNLLVDLQDRLGLAMVFIGHDLPVVTYVAPQLAVMLSGRIVELLPKGVPLSRARHPYTRDLLAAVPSITSPSLPAIALSRGPAEAPFSLDRCVYWERCKFRSDECCETESPPLREIEPGHHVACFYDIPLETPATGITTEARVEIPPDTTSA
jgi:oligopeptide/dipeptide ABC transporter ATP-binding protein